jgi:N-glycosylase/DNA lyase
MKGKRGARRNVYVHDRHCDGGRIAGEKEGIGKISRNRRWRLACELENPGAACGAGRALVYCNGKRGFAIVEVKMNDFDIQKTADSGQCFRMRGLGDGSFGAAAGQRFVRITPRGDGHFAFSCSREEFDGFWADYFDMQTDYGAILGAVEEDDTFLCKAVAHGRGIRILRQMPWEVAVSFVISQRKSIGAIRTAIEALCRACGTPMETEVGRVYGFPTPAQLAALTIEELRACSLGYRDKYVAALAKGVNEGTLPLEGIAGMDDEAAKAALTKVFGIGDKVADCILLFGYRRLDAFPVDVWMRRVIDGAYGGAFPADRYPGIAGILQQFLFFYARDTRFMGAGKQGERARYSNLESTLPLRS